VIGPRSERRKIFLGVCVGGREERSVWEERREDVDEGRSGDWLKIGEISKKGSSKILHRRLVSVGFRARIFFIRPSGDPIRRGVTTLNETLAKTDYTPAHTATCICVTRRNLTRRTILTHTGFSPQRQCGMSPKKSSAL
jgi:hypothetical protein